MNAGTNSFTPDDSLVFAPNGSLFASVTTANGQREKLLRLLPAASSWCQVPKAFGDNTGTYGVGSMRVNRTDLLWTEQTSPNGAAASMSLHVVPFSSLRC
jgi:hypothetical protein